MLFCGYLRMTKLGKVRKFRKWRNYNKEDYRIEPYCKGECPYCLVKKDNGQAFCYGRFERLEDGASFNVAGLECTKVINICFSEKYRLIER